MTNVLIRDVPSDDLERIRSEAAERNTSLQNYLRDTVQAQATHLRRQDALAATAERLRGCPEVLDEERKAVLDAIEDAHDERGDQLGDRPTP